MEIRKTGVGFLLISAGLLFLVMAVFGNVLIERALESAGQLATGARVEFDGVQYFPGKNRLRWRKLQVANPNNTWFNLIETGPVDIDLSLEPLFSRRYISPNMQADSISFFNLRTTDGALPGRAPVATTLIDRIQELFRRELLDLPLYQLSRMQELDIDSLIRVLDLKTPLLIDSLSKKAESTYLDWSVKLDTSGINERINVLREQIDTLRVGQVNSIEEFIRLARQIELIVRRIDSLSTIIENIRTGLGQAVRQHQQYTMLLTNSIEQDRERLLEIARLPRINAENVNKAVFGPVIIERYQSILTCIGMSRYYNQQIRAFLPDRRPRLTGVTIPFSSRRNWPELWIERMTVSGRLFRNAPFAGTALNLLVRQEVVGLPTEISLEGREIEGLTLGISGILDYLSEIPRERFSINAGGMPLQGNEFYFNFLLPVRINSGIGSVRVGVDFDGNVFSASTTFSASGLSLSLQDQDAENNNLLVIVSRSIVESIRQIEIGAQAIYSQDSLQFTVTSSVGEVLAGILRDAFTPFLDSLRIELDNRIEDAVAGPRDELFRVAARFSGLVSRTDELESALSDLSERLAAKRRELTNRKR